MEPSVRRELFEQLREVLNQHRSYFSVSESDRKFSLSTTKAVEVDGKVEDFI